MGFETTLTILAFTATLSCAQISRLIPDTDISATLLVGNSIYQPPRSNEYQLPNDVKRYTAFIESLESSNLRPNTTPSIKEVSVLLSNVTAIREIIDDRVTGDNTTVTRKLDLVNRVNADLSRSVSYINFLEPLTWYGNVMGCCPRYQSFQCGTTVESLRLPCMFYWPYGWCCPIQEVYIRKCNCKTCYKLCFNCIYSGTCVPRYTYQSYLSVCWNGWLWYSLYVFQTYLPTSCYCSNNVLCTMAAQEFNPIDRTQR
ncbi:hypothetical protein Bpfe_003950 [Biomphalaria pfeifferi]|uniref:Uncharacterized protein n=1 Tax=Biomphalaria pfeifferi TaxID=112525 RepID=A0AAD8C6E8_BIOPF|nr:hypothetical protein Bpfe_003950 [Biomphalaria pfeifferi]